MLEVRITIDAPELSGAINNLAASLGTRFSETPVHMQAPSLQQTAVPTAPPISTPVPQQASPASTVSATPILQQTAVPTAPPMPTPVPQQASPAPNVPLAQPQQYTVDQIMAAGATLMDSGKVNELINLLHSFGVQAVMDLRPEQLGPFATAMRELGAKI